MQFLQPRYNNKLELFRKKCENIQAMEQAKISRTSKE